MTGLVRALLAAALVAACGLPAACAGPLAGELVQIRILNGSSETMEGVRVALDDGWMEAGTLEPGEATNHVPVGRAYRTATAEARVRGVLLRLQVIDHVGEEPLRPGLYTYRLDVVDEEHLTLQVIRDYLQD